MTTIEIMSNHPSYAPDLAGIADVTRQIQNEMALSALELIIIFVEDSYLKDLHSTYLDDDSVTDIMTFNLSDDDEVEGEIYISIDRARDNATSFEVAEQEEICRLIIHGLLHLKGHDDETPEEKKQMRELENFHLANSLPDGWKKAFSNRVN
ncbi:MAG: rRNA maturation RNase YbeY [Calditrichia bacterium]